MSELPGANNLSPMSYLKIFFRRKELLLIPTIIGLVLGICTGIILPKEFMSTTVILVEEGKSDNPLFEQLAVSTTVMQRLASIKESMLGWNSLHQLVKRLEMDREVKTPRQLEELIMAIRDKIDIKMKGNNIIHLTYTGRDPEMTQAVVKNITEIFIERNVDIQNQETSDAISFIEEQLKVYIGKIKSAEIAQLRDALTALLVDSTESHPRVKELREQIATREAELREQKLEYTENVSLDPKTTNPIIKEIRLALENIEGGTKISSLKETGGADSDLYKVMLIDKLDNVMARDVGVNEKIYNMLLQRLETARITQRLQASKEGTKYAVLDPPRVPLDPIKPNKVLVAFIGLILGLLVGFGFVVGTEFLDKSFLDVEEAKQFLGVPLIGAISKITTENAIRLERERHSWLYSLTIIAGVVLIILTTAISNFLN